MKYLIFFLLPCTFLPQLNSRVTHVENQKNLMSIENAGDGDKILFQDEHGYARMSAVEFKNQKYCRAELENFEFDAHFSIVSATVYFSGTNFKNLERGFITSSSLKPVAEYMSRCSPGSRIVFDDVKVVGPDNKQRTIQGVSLVLY